MTLLRVTRSAVSRILIGLLLYDRFPPRSSCSIGIYSSGTRKHFLSYDTWNMSCTSNSSSWYTTSPLRSMIWKSPTYLGANFPMNLNLRVPLIGETFRYTKSPTSNERPLLLLSVQLFCHDCAIFKLSLIIWTCLSRSRNTSGMNMLSPIWLQNNGVLHYHPYKASKGANSMLAW
jgi:hypothetical protein